MINQQKSVNVLKAKAFYKCNGEVKIISVVSLQAWMYLAAEKQLTMWM